MAPQRRESLRQEERKGKGRIPNGSHKGRKETTVHIQAVVSFLAWLDDTGENR